MEKKHHSGLTISDTQFRTGVITGQPWDKVVQALIDSKQLYLHKGERVTGISFDINYGLYIQIGFTP